MEDAYEKAYSPKEVCIALDINASVQRKWCLALERNGYKFIRNDSDHRVFVENDLVVLRHFQNLVKHHNMPLENAASLVIDRFGKGAFEPGTDIVPAEKEQTQEDLQREFMRSLDAKMNEKMNELRSEMLEKFNREFIQSHQEISTALAQLPQPKTREEERLERITDMITKRRIEQDLKTEALDLWAAKPESERTIKAGFFRKVEDRDKKEKFIDDYINAHFEERIKKEYGTDYSTRPQQ